MNAAPSPGRPGARGRFEALNAALSSGGLMGDAHLSPYAASLPVLLEALGWQASPRRVFESLPHFSDDIDITDLREVLANLGFRTRPLSIAMADIDRELLPCLYVGEDGTVSVVRRSNEGGVRVYDATRQAECDAPGSAGSGVAYIVDRMPQDPTGPDDRAAGRFGSFASQLRSLLLLLCGLSVISNLLALVVPLFTMAVYDQVIGKNSPETLPYLVAGLAFMLLWEILIRSTRQRLISYVGGRLDYLIGTNGFAHLLRLPTAFTDRASVGSQLSRLREFEAIRGFFASPLSTAMLDLPFALILVVVIGIIAWPLALVPLGALLVLGLASTAFAFTLAELSRRANLAQAARHGFLVEMLAKMRSLKLLGAERVWYERYRLVSADAEMSGYRARLAASSLQTLGQVSVVGAGAGTLLVGSLLVMAGDLSVGGLIACLALTWRALAPIVTLLSTASRITNVRNAIRRFNNMMRLKGEATQSSDIARQRITRGRIAFSRVSLRYMPNAEPALLGVSFDAEPGEVVVIVGATGAGKSSLIKLIAGLYTPQAGSVSIDGIDVRQLDPLELRQTVAYVPQYDSFFYGTIAQNLLLANPGATTRELHEAADLARIKDEILAFPDGFESRIGDNSIKHLPPGFHRRLALARAYLRGSRVILLDEPADGLDADADEAFIAAIRSLAGRATILMSTHRPSHMRLADKIIYLKDGRTELAGPADKVLKVLQAQAA